MPERQSRSTVVALTGTADAPLGDSRGLALLEMLHPVPVLLTLVAAGLFALAAGRGHTRISTLVTILAVTALSQAAISIYNDVCDVDVDRVARPSRALPRGFMSLGTATTVALLAASAAVLIALAAGVVSALMVAVGTASGLLYSSVFKRTAWSWVPFAIAFPLLPVWVFVATGHVPASVWTVFAIGIPLAVAIHLADSLPDLETDVAAGMTGLACVLGRRAASRACVLLACAAAAAAAALAPLTDVPIIALGGSGAAILLIALGSQGATSESARRHLVALAALILGASWVGSLTL